EARVGLVGQVDVVAVAAAAHQQAGVFLAQDRLTETPAGRACSRLQKGHVSLRHEAEGGRPRVARPRRVSSGRARRRSGRTATRADAGIDQTVVGWNSRTLPSGSLHRSWIRPPGWVFSMYVMPSRSRVVFIAS